MHVDHAYAVTSRGFLVHNSTPCNILYRVLRADQNPAFDLVAKNTAAKYSVHAHVSKGNELATQFISTTKNRAKAEARAAKEGLKVVEIDVSKLGSAELIDLTDPKVVSEMLKHPIPRNFAKDSEEVLILGIVPANAIKVLAP